MQGRGRKRKETFFSFSLKPLKPIEEDCHRLYAGPTGNFPLIQCRYRDDVLETIQALGQVFFMRPSLLSLK